MGSEKKFEVSLMSSLLISLLEKGEGLCTRRFHADYVTDNLDYTGLKVGDIVKPGDKAVRILRVGKTCFPECEIKTKPCPLASNVAFGEYTDDNIDSKGN